MTGTNQNNKRAVETILVTTGDLALVNDTGAGGALPGGGTRVAATTDLPLMSAVNTGQVNLSPGQLGVFSAYSSTVRLAHTAILSTDTFNDAPEIYVALGGATAQNPGAKGAYPLTNTRPYESSGVILGRHHIVTAGRLAAFDAYSVWNIGNTSAMNATPNTEYAINIAYHGQVQDTENSMHGYATTTVNYMSPNYTALGLVDDLDHLIQNLVYQVNRNSREFWAGASIWGANEPMIAFGVELVAGADTDINNVAFDGGGVVPVFIKDGLTYTVTLSQEQVISLRTAIPATHGIKTVNLSTAGGAADCVYMTIMALDRDLAYNDRVPQVKIRLDLGLLRGFDLTVSKTQTSFSYEGEGKGRHWFLFEESTSGQRKYSQYQRQHFPFITVPSGIDSTLYYNTYIIEHRSVGENGISNVSVSPKKTIILIPACDTTTRDSLEAILNVWVKSVPSYTLLNDGVGGDLNLPNFDTTYCA